MGLSLSLLNFFTTGEGAEVIANLLRTVSHCEEEPECSCS